MSTMDSLELAFSHSRRHDRAFLITHLLAPAIRRGGNDYIIFYCIFPFGNSISDEYLIMDNNDLFLTLRFSYYLKIKQRKYYLLPCSSRRIRDRNHKRGTRGLFHGGTFKLKRFSDYIGVKYHMFLSQKHYKCTKMQQISWGVMQIYPLKMYQLRYT